MPDDLDLMFPDSEENRGNQLTPSKDDERAIKAAVASVASTIKDAQHYVPPVRIVTTPDNMQVIYSRDTEPKCRLCMHPMRDQAEEVYILSSYVVSKVERWLNAESDEKWSWDQVGNHMTKHCDFKDPMINYLSKLNSRAEEVDVVMADPLEFFMRSLGMTFLEVGEFDTRKDVARAKGLADTKVKIASEFAKLFDMRSKYSGPQEQAEAMIARNNAKMRGMMEAMMKVVTEEQRKEILAIASQFSQQEE